MLVASWNFTWRYMWFRSNLFLVLCRKLLNFNTTTFRYSNITLRLRYLCIFSFASLAINWFLINFTLVNYFFSLLWWFNIWFAYLLDDFLGWFQVINDRFRWNLLLSLIFLHIDWTLNLIVWWLSMFTNQKLFVLNTF